MLMLAEIPAAIIKARPKKTEELKRVHGDKESMRCIRDILLFTLCAIAIVSTSRAVPGGTYTVTEVHDGGTVAGTVKWSGEPVKPLSVPITKDADICDPEKAKSRDLERIIVGPGGGVENTVVYLVDVTRGKAMNLPETRRALDQKSCRYIPHVSLVPADTEFRLKSSDPILHTVHMEGAADFNLPFPFQNQFIARTLHKPGVIDLKCNAGHIWMNGVVLVVRHPYYAVTDDHGDFELTDVPPGEYQIAAWHESWKVAREEPTLDVATQKMTKRLFYGEPITIQKKVEVKPSAKATVNFQLSAQ
jgi:hypothetical protein